MRFLIIGSKGFIGSHCLKFFQSNHEVWGCDVFTDYTEPNYFLSNGINFAFSSIFKEMEFDICINCSGAASVSDSILHPSRDYELNVFNVARILEAIRQHNPTCKFINISSAAVYGNPKVLPISETIPINPLSPYGFHKSMAEHLCEEYFKIFGIATCSLRIFSAFGPGLKKQLFWDIYSKSRAADSISLFGTGEETRDYVFISDIVNAINVVIDKSAFTFSIYNIARGEAMASKQIANLFLGVLGWKGKLTFSGGKRQGDPDFWQADISKIKDLGFEPLVSIEDGIKQYASWLSLLD